MLSPHQSADASIKAMRARYSAEVLEAEKRLAALRAKVQVLDELLQEQRELLSGQEIIPGVIKDDALGKDGAMPSGMTDAILWVISKFGRGSPLGAGDIKSRLKTYGFKPNGKNYVGVLTTTLKRLRLTERISAEKIDGRWIYRAIP